MKFKVAFVFILIVFVFQNSHGQKADDYFIVTIEDEYKPSYHGIATYYFIIPVDSIDSDWYKFKIFPFYSDWASNDKLKRCIDNLPIAIFTATTQSNYDYPKSYLEEIDKLEKLIKSGRKLAQKVIKKHPKNESRKIKIFLTPISGKFCNCKVLKGSVLDKNFNYLSEIYLPVSNFKINKSLWQTKEGKSILKVDIEKKVFPNII
ncbi:hypothetical protein MWU58_07075 [Flavobacteriaceae bacterium S0825]|uniref:hypothetical protein n=1 Tax=Gaetbulibacter sp. S0825 TaxID=2720084 RepID=UPI0014313AAF|nr:hypothetical protein [Gaetbulibacter sp. S0825]MCK0109049.1 hypothetical protein [Flavobacteriaceae bacterium S0825]NIX64684.1 hypothetical protein [Gaetbulibacter sp. S0825]